MSSDSEERDGFQQIQEQQQQQQHPPLHMRITRRTSITPINEPIEYTSFVCGLLAGVAQAGIFNPYDRALYLSVTNHRPFLAWENWRSPYTGFFQSIGGRALSGGLYFPLEHLFLRILGQHQPTRRCQRSDMDPKYNLLAGTAAGLANAVVLNPVSAIKYKTWGREVNQGMLKEAFGMVKKSGSLRPFGNGLVPTIYRDVVFGACYTWLRLQIQYSFQLYPHEQWKGNLTAAALATVLSGPFNYVRNIQYATSSRDRADGTLQVLRSLAHETGEQPTVARQLYYLQNRLRIGWGTARVACGITFAHGVYDWLHENLHESVQRLSLSNV
jgi:hypothetical protein